MNWLRWNDNMWRCKTKSHTSPRRSLAHDAGEPLLLALEEAFFLQYALQCLDVTTEDGIELTVEQAWRFYRRLDARFAEKYVAYHFHRSHGWCPKQGIKFGSDWILYKKGPQYHHASYQVIVTRLARESLVVGADEHRDALAHVGQSASSQSISPKACKRSCCSPM
jgi:tRNA-intron lyase